MTNFGTELLKMDNSTHNSGGTNRVRFRLRLEDVIPAFPQNLSTLIVESHLMYKSV